MITLAIKTLLVLFIIILVVLLRGNYIEFNKLGNKENLKSILAWNVLILLIVLTYFICELVTM